jgi:Tol biopolymer transport system component
VRRSFALVAASAAALVLLGSAEGAFPGSNGLIAYACNSSSVCRVNPDGGAAGVLISSAADPAWSPSGARIAYRQNGAIYTANADGSSPQLFVNDASQPAWSNDNATIAFIDNASHLAIKTSSAIRELTATTDSDPAVSPNGRTIVYAALTNSYYQLFTVPTSGSGLPAATQLTTDAADHVAPVWSPDGSTILFENTNGLATVPAGGGTVTQVVTGDAHDPTYSPDGTKIAYATSGGSLVVATSSGGSPSTIVSSFSNANNPDWGSAALTATAPSSPSDTVGGPTNTSYPPITLTSGDTTPVVGHSLVAGTGTWSGTFPISYAYQWKRCDPGDPVNGSCFTIPGATSSTYTPTAAEYGMRIRVAVSATNSDGRHTQNSEVTQPVAAIAPKNTATPPITPGGTNVVDQVLSVASGTWQGSTPLAFTYSWRRCDPVGTIATCVPIAGATSSSYVPTVADIGFSIRVWITGANILGSDVVITNHTFPIVDKQHFAPSATIAPTIAGVALPGRQLTANIGAYKGDAPIATTFHWYRCDAIGGACHAIAGASKVVYLPSAGDVGFTLRLFVLASNAYGKLLAQSDPTAAIAATPPHVRGRRIVGTAAADYLAGGGHDDTILGLGGNDTLLGGAGDDRIDGGGGNDVITGGAGADTIFGGPGSDTISSVDGERDVVACGAGQDRVDADAFDIVAKDCEVVNRPAAP